MDDDEESIPLEMTLENCQQCLYRIEELLEKRLPPARTSGR